MARILVTGGAGYIGSATVFHLRQSGYDIEVLDDLSMGFEHNVREVPLHRVNLLDTAAVTKVLAEGRFEAVVHFAAFISVGESTVNPEKYFLNNVGGTLSLLSAMATRGISRIVFSSTAAVYGAPRSVPIREDAGIAPLNPYGESKATVERILHWCSECRGLRSVGLRYFNACGAIPESGFGEEHVPETHLIPLLLRAAYTGKAITIFGDDYPTPDGTCLRDYIHIGDLAEAHRVALAYLADGGATDVFNVGTGTGFSVREVMAAVEKVTGLPVPHVFGPRREGDSPELVADSTKLRHRLKWQPRYRDLESIVKTAWDFERKRASISATA